MPIGASKKEGSELRRWVVSSFVILLVLAAALLVPFDPAVAAEEAAVPASPRIFLYLYGVSGESTVYGHAKEIDVLSLGYGVEKPEADAKFVIIPEFSAISFSKYVDVSTPKLLDGCCRGTYYPSAIFTVSRVSDKCYDFYKLLLLDVHITSVSHTIQPGDPSILETVTFMFHKLKVEYTQYDDATGKPVGTVRFGWDLDTNMPMR
jgi:type VI secretion system secreted protein Hcp